MRLLSIPRLVPAINLVVLSGNAPESYANLAIKLFIRQPAVFQLQDQNWSTMPESNRLSLLGRQRHSQYANGALDQVVGVEPTHLRWQRKRLPLHHTCFLTMNIYYHHQRKWQAPRIFIFSLVYISVMVNNRRLLLNEIYEN